MSAEDITQKEATLILEAEERFDQAFYDSADRVGTSTKDLISIMVEEFNKAMDEIRGMKSGAAVLGASEACIQELEAIHNSAFRNAVDPSAVESDVLDLVDGYEQ